MRRFVASIVVSIVLAAVGLAQSDNRIELPQASVTAGDHIDAKLTLQTPVACDTGAHLFFVDAKVHVQFQIVGIINSGQTTVTIGGTIPRDVPAGDYESGQGQLNPCPDYQNSINFTVPAKILNVKAFPNPVHLPNSADLELSLTQKQFLDTKVAQLSALSSELDSGVQDNSAELPRLREFLAGIVDSAEMDLTTTERQYREKILKPQEKSPAFFADFHAQYEALRANLRAPIPGYGKASADLGAGLVRAQLRTRTPNEQLSGTRSPDIIAVWQTIKDNIAAYLIVKSGRITFRAQLTSYPSGARIQYKKTVDDQFEDYSSPTDVSNASFELATWDFRFHKDGCPDDRALHIDPYQESEPVNVSVEFAHCKGR